MPDPSPALLPSARAALLPVLGQVAARPGELAAVLGSVAEALIAFTADRRILAANAGAEALFGYAAGALAGRSTDELIPARLRQPGAPPMAPLADILEIELPGQRLDGAELTVEWIVGTALAGPEPIFVMIVRDHAVAERALEALRASEERFRLLVETAREYAIFLLDASGHVSSWNLGAQRTKGWPAAEILGQSYAAFFTPEDRAAGTPERFLATAAREGSLEVTGWRVRKDGSRFRANATLTALRSPSGVLTGFAKITRDLTAKLEAEELERSLAVERAARAAAEQAEAQLRASEERLARLQRVTAALSEAPTPAAVASVVLEHALQAVGAATGVVYVLAPDGGTLDLVDSRGYDSVFIAARARLGLDMSGPVPAAARTRAPYFFETAAAAGHEFPDWAATIAASGLEAATVLPLVSRGALLGVIGLRYASAHTTTPVERSLLLTLAELCAQALERARLFTAESAARATAEAANRSKDEFLAILGHELRNPLAPIVTALELLEPVMQTDGPAHRARAAIDRHVKHLIRLVDDLLDVSRITQKKIDLQRARVEIAEVVARAVELASPLIEQRHHAVSILVAPQGLAVDGDVTRLAQVVSNLLTNAARYTPPHGHIEIAAARDGDQIVLTVRDNGIGIAPQMLPHVFELFAQERQSLDRSQGGLGLGLAIVRSLVGMHGGSVTAASAGRDRGSVFTVTLPASEQRTAAVAAATPAAELAAGTPLRVLVVDDNVDAAELMALALRRHGHTLAVAYDGPAALALASTFRPDVALLDIGLPVMDGYELARHLRAQHGGVRLVALTGYGQADDRARAHAAGFDVHLVKPVDVAALRAILAS